MKKKTLIVLPTYNEAGNVKTLIPEIFNQNKKVHNWQIIVLVVDDNSPDKTTQIVKLLQKRFSNLFLLTGEKKGLGKAYQRGFIHGIKHYQPDVIFEMDADWSHDPEVIPRFLAEIDKGADFVIGSRYIKNGSIPADWGIHRKIFSYCGNLVIRLGFMKLKIHDWTNGYRAVKSSFINKSLKKCSGLDGYIFQIALIDQAIKNKLQIKEIPIHFKNRAIGQSKINSIQFIYNILLYILKNSDFIKFCIVGIIGAFIDFGISYVLIDLFKRPVWASTTVSAEAAIISNFLLNNFWSFSYKKIRPSYKSYLKAFVKFNSVSLGSIIIQSSLLQIAVWQLGITYWYIYKALIIFCVIIPYSYILYNKFIWKK